MRKRATTAVVAIATMGATGAGVALAAGGSSRLDDGKDLLSQAKITEQQATDAAQAATPGSLNEVDLEHLDGKLVWNVDVGRKDVRVDATSGEVVRVDGDD